MKNNSKKTIRAHETPMPDFVPLREQLMELSRREPERLFFHGLIKALDSGALARRAIVCTCAGSKGKIHLRLEGWPGQQQVMVSN